MQPLGTDQKQTKEDVPNGIKLLIALGKNKQKQPNKTGKQNLSPICFNLVDQNPLEYFKFIIILMFDTTLSLYSFVYYIYVIFQKIPYLIVNNAVLHLF